VEYAGTEIMHRVATARARAGNWSEVTVVSVARRPNIGAHMFRGRVAVDGVVSTRAIVFSIKP
jgi:hypothetical protein